MSTFTFFSSPGRCIRWLAAWLLWLLGSSGLAYGQSTSPFAVRLTPSGAVGLSAGQTQLLTATAVRPAFITGTGFNNAVTATAVQPDGKVLVGGSFTTYNGSTRKYLARLNADGSLDNSFAAGTELNGAVRAIALQPNGAILIGGDFTTYGAAACLRLARLSPTGILDPSFAPSGLNNTVRAITMQAGGVLVGGDFTAYGTATASAYLVRLDANGNLDTGFATTSHAVSNLFNNTVRAIVVQSNGSILVGGSFSGNRVGIARLSNAGALDAAFNPTGNGPVASSINTIAEFNSGILVGGDFKAYASGGVANTTYKGLAFLDSGGGLNTNFTFSFGTAGGTVHSLAVLSATQVAVGGSFTATASGNTYINNLVGLTTTGNIDTAFDANGFTTPSNPVYSLALNSQSQPANDRLVVGGQFDSYKGAINRCIARLKLNGSFDDLDVPIAGAIYQWNGSVTNAVTNAKNATAQATTTGLYSATATVSGMGGPIASNSVAITVATVSLAPIAVRVAPGGPLTLGAGQSQLLVATTVQPALSLGTGFNDQVKALAVQPDGKVLVGGSFTSYSSTTLNRKRIARLNADGSLDNTFAPTGAGFDAAITSLAVQPDGKVLVGGDFTSYNGTATRRHIARLNIDGSLDNTFAATGAGLSNSTTALVVQPDGKILVAGNFPFYTDANGISLPSPTNYIARLNPDGSRDLGFNLIPGASGFNAYTTALALQPNGKVLVGGFFSTYNGKPCDGVVRLNADGSLDPSFTSGVKLHNAVTALVLQPDGKVLVADVKSNRVVRLNADGSLDITFAPAGTVGTSHVSVLALQPNGKLLVGMINPGLLVRFDINGVLDPTFAPNGTGFGPTGNSVNGGYATTLTLQPDGKVLALGTFTSYNGTAGVNRIAHLTETGALSTDVALTGATYAWSNGSTGPTLPVTTSGTYSATATLLGQTATSNVVTATVGNQAPANFSVRLTPAGPLRLCPSGPGGSQTLTAQAQVAGATATGTYTYKWWQMQNGTPVFWSSGTPYPATNPTGSTLVVSAGTSPEQYFATAETVTGTTTTTAASPTVTVAPIAAPSLTTSTPVTGSPGSSITLTGTNLNLATGVFFGTVPAAFVVNSAAQLLVTVPAGATTGTLSIATACAAYVYPPGFLLPPAAALTITSVTPQSATAGSTILLTGTGFGSGPGATTVSLNGVPMSVTVVSSTQLTAIVPPGLAASTHPLSVTVAGVSATATLTVYVAAAAQDKVYDTTVTLPANSTYNSIIIKAPGDVTISGSGAGPNGNLGLTVHHLEVQEGATLNVTDTTVVVGSNPGSDFLLAAGATLNVGHPNGISSRSTPGAIQFKKRFFSPDASYGYIGSQFQATGDTLPSQVRNLTSDNPRGLKLSRPVSIAQVLKMSGAGNFYLNDQPLTILSNATGTGLVVNDAGAGQVLGTATVQRHINPVANNGLGFRYYGSPVKGATVAVLAATVFDYDQSRYRPKVEQDTLPPIAYGFTTGALAPNTPLEVGRGYRAAVPAATTVRFTGTLTTGDISLVLARKGNGAYNGWHLVSNPYPAPLNWTKLIAAGDITGLDAAVYVYESTGTNTGAYRCFVNGVRNDGKANSDLIIAMGQAFFVRVSKGYTAGTLTFRDSHRLTTYAEQVSFNRLTAKRFELTAALQQAAAGGSGGGCYRCNHSDLVAIYVDAKGVSSFEQAFNPGLDADASNLFTFSRQTLSIRQTPRVKQVAGVVNPAVDSTVAIRAMTNPLANQVRTMPLVISATSAGTYLLTLNLKNLPLLTPGLVPYLHDSSPTGLSNATWTDLTAAGTTSLVYPFDLSATDILNGVSSRFDIVFRPALPLATTPTTTGLGSAAVYPNPTRQHIHVWVPALPGATQVQATLYNGLGQPVHQQLAPLPAIGASLNLAVEGLAGGVYILRLQAGGTTVTRRVVLEN